MSYLKKLGIQIKNGWVHYKNKHVPISKIDTNNFYDTLLLQLGIRKTRGTDFYDGKRFIKPTILTELSKKIAKSYAVTIKFDWTNTNYNKTYVNKITSFVSRVVNDDVLEDKARESAVEYAKSRSIPESGDNIEISNIVILEKREANKTDLRDLPFFGATLTYPKLGLKVLNNNGLCGYELLLKNYKSKAKSIEYLEEFFDKYRDDGLTARDIYKLCETHNIPYYVTDLRKKCILRLPSADHNSNTKALIVTIANQHCYEITDKTMRSKIVNRNKGISTFKQEPKKDERESIYVKDIPIKFEENKKYYVDADNLNDYYLKLLDNNKCYPAKYMQDEVTEIHFETSKLATASKFEEMKETAKLLNIPYTNQSPARLAREYFDTIKGDNWKESTPNPIIRKYMESDAMKIGAFNETLTEQFPSNYKIIGIDKNKQYTSMVIRGDFHYVDADNEVFRYNGEDIAYGCFYYIKNQVLFPMGGDGFYYYQVVAAYLDYGLITQDDIKFYFNTKKQPDSLKTFINDVYKTKQNKARQ